MTSDLTLSGQVQSFLDTLDWEDDHDMSPAEEKEMSDIRKVVKLIVDNVIASRETLTGNKLPAVEKLVTQMPDVIVHLLDDRYTRQLVDAVPGYVRRTLQLSRLEGSAIPSKATNSYLQEAVRTYILGLPQASVALCRAAMEQALKENLGHQGTRFVLEKNESLMSKLLDEAEGAGLIDGTVRRMAREVSKAANDVLHEKPTDLKRAYEVLLKLRGILQHLYAE